MNDKEYLDQIWNELENGKKIACFIHPFEGLKSFESNEKYWREMGLESKKVLITSFKDKLIDLFCKKLKEAEQLPDTADHKAERIERLNLLLNYLRGE